ncbi:unnamed protein product [Paramecium octaurelia]|uniref:Protein kinase domain-containing protein n=1 Tax=Paramecium octaurelia TaxID=43137 RepID=A0A8S1SCB8_PAROT|nr:unnamed protein product [Paramecium octaurelia]
MKFNLVHNQLNKITRKNVQKKNNSKKILDRLHNMLMHHTLKYHKKYKQLQTAKSNCSKLDSFYLWFEQRSTQKITHYLRMLISKQISIILSIIIIFFCGQMKLGDYLMNSFPNYNPEFQLFILFNKRTDIVITIKQGSIQIFTEWRNNWDVGNSERFDQSNEIGKKNSVRQLLKVDQKNMLSKTNILKEQDHPNIIKIYELFSDEKYYYLIMNNQIHTRTFDRENCCRIYATNIRLQKICSYINPENIIFESMTPSWNLKNIDFVTSCKIEFLTLRIELYYIAPEVLKRNFNEKCGELRSDILSIVMWVSTIWTRRQRDLESIQLGKQEFEPEDWTTRSDDSKNMISKMITLDSTKRISAQEAFNDPLIQECTNGSLQFQSSQKFGFLFCTLFLLLLISNHAESYINANHFNQFHDNQEKEDCFKSSKKIDKDGKGQIRKEDLILGKHKIIIVYLKKYNDTKMNQIFNDIFEKVDRRNYQIRIDQNKHLRCLTQQIIQSILMPWVFNKDDFKVLIQEQIKIFGTKSQLCVVLMLMVSFLNRNY